MKKIHLLILLCSISPITIFAAENKKNETHASKFIDYQIHLNKIAELEKKHAQEIAMYEAKFQVLMNDQEKRKTTKDQFETNRAD